MYAWYALSIYTGAGLPRESEPSSFVMANMTGTALYQTFENSLDEPQKDLIKEDNTEKTQVLLSILLHSDIQNLICILTRIKCSNNTITW